MSIAVFSRAGASAAFLGAMLAFGQGTPDQRVSSLTGTIKKIPAFHSQVLKNDRDLIVYLPPNYGSEPNRRFPVLYMADGQNIFDGLTSYIPNKEWKADEAAESLINANAIEPLIIVGVNNAGMDRGNEYLPTFNKDNGYGGKADLYAQMLIEEIKPMIDWEYRTKTGDTGLAGSSFGGILTLHLGLTHPEVFSKLAVVSPSIWWDGKVMVKKIATLPAKLKLKIWLDIGTSESPSAEADAKEAADALIAKGWKPGKDLIYYVDGYAKHNEDAWARRFPAMLMFLYGKR